MSGHSLPSGTESTASIICWCGRTLTTRNGRRSRSVFDTRHVGAIASAKHTLAFEGLLNVVLIASFGAKHASAKDRATLRITTDLTIFVKIVILLAQGVLDGLYVGALICLSDACLTMQSRALMLIERRCGWLRRCWSIYVWPVS